MNLFPKEIFFNRRKRKGKRKEEKETPLGDKRINQLPP